MLIRLRMAIPPSIPTTDEQRRALLERNLSALRAVAPELAARVAQATPTPLEWVETAEGPSAVLHGKALASKRRPKTEADTIAATLDKDACGLAVCSGFGLGYLPAALVEQFQGTGLVIAVEPDLGLLRSVFEHMDHAPWIAKGQFTILADPEDATQISNLTRQIEGLIAVGVKFAQHPADAQRLAGKLDTFHARFHEVVRAVRSQVLTTLMQVDTTVRNLIMNADHYVRSPGLESLEGALKGRPAVVVSAGPSFQKNVDLLAEPGVRDRVCIIAVQTTLRPLLERGIKPHFVVALDYAEISKRFYEGLTAADVEGITLVAEAKANPAILDAYPGRVMCVANDTLDQIVGKEVLSMCPGSRDAKAVRGLKAGATVAHLAGYLARHMGCDPLVFIGQDLGFTDGQYYGSGASIHRVWSGELGPFRSLEMLEWERVARQGSLLHKATDVLGRPIFTDEQMHSYLVQFEQDFKDDERAGLTTIDATEGGVRKNHTTLATLRETLDRFEDLAPFIAPQPERGRPPEPARVAARMTHLASRVREVGTLSRETKKHLEQMLEHHGDQHRVNTLIEKVQSISKRAQAITPAFGLVQHINQTGTLNRFKADRSLRMETELEPLEKQKRQIERDIQNVGWLADAAEHLASMLDEGAAAHRGQAPKLTREAAPETLLTSVEENAPVRAVICVDFDRSGLGTPRDLAEDLVLGENALRLTLRRLARAEELDGAVLITDQPERAAKLAGIDAGGGTIDGLRVDLHATAEPPIGERHRAIAQARLSAQNAWRGGIGQLSVFDEVFNADRTLEVMDRFGLSAAVLVGCDWALTDPHLASRLIEHHREHPESRQFAFVHAACGFGSALLARKTVEDLLKRSNTGGPFATIGGMLGYAPLGPLPDLIGRPNAIAAEPVARDLGVRAIPDTPQRRSALAGVLQDFAAGYLDLSSARLAEEIAAHARTFAGPVPTELFLELCTGRMTSGVRTHWLHRADEVVERPVMIERDAKRLIDELAENRPNAVLHLEGLGDPLLHPRCAEFVRHAKASGIPFVHVRTDLQQPDRGLELIDVGVDAVSVDVLARDPETYRTLLGVDRYDTVTQGVRTLGDAKPLLAGLPSPWIVPRITRCDLVYEQIENFYGEWLCVTGAAVIDPAPVAQPRSMSADHDDRITPITVPPEARARFKRERLIVQSDGTALDSRGRPAGNALAEGLVGTWSRAVRGTPLQHESLQLEGLERVA